MILRLRKVSNDLQDLKGVLPVLDRRLYDGGDGGVVLHAGLGTEASADLEFGLGRPERLLTVIVRRRDIRIGQEGEDVVPMLGDALLEFIQVGVLPVISRIDGRPRKQLVESFLRLRSHFRTQVSLIPLVYGVPQEIQHVQAPGIVREGLHRVGEVPQQMGDADLMVLHPDIPHEIGRPAVGNPDHSALLLFGEVFVHNFMAASLVKGQESGDRVLEGPEPVVLSAHVDTGLVRARHPAGGDLLTDHLIGRLGELAHRVQHVGYGSFAYMEPEDSFVQMREPLERDVLVSAEVRGQRHDVGAVGHRRVHVFRELTLAAVAARALDLHQQVIEHFRQDGERDVHHLTSGADRSRVHVQRFSALRTHRRGVPALLAGDTFRLQPRAALVAELTSGLAAGRLALGLRVRNADRVLGRRDAAVRAGLRNRDLAVLKRGQLRLQLCNPGILCCDLLISYREDEVHPGEFAILFLNRSGQVPIHLSLGMQPLRKFRRVKILGEPHLSEKTFTTPGKFREVCLDALTKSGIEVLSHTTKVGKRFDICKCNTLCISGLGAICRPCNEVGIALFGGPDVKFFKGSTAPKNANNKLIFNHLKTRLAV